MSVVEAAFVAVVLVAMLTLLFVGWKTPEIVVFLALVFVWNAGIISTQDALSGFNNPGVLAVGSLFVVIKGVEKSRLADKAAKHVFGLRTSCTAGLLRLMGLSFLLSAFLNNTPVVALLIPITKDWALTRGFSPSLLLMPLSFACIFGGLITIIGTSTNLVVQGLVIEAGDEDPTIQGLGFFEPGYIGLPLGIAGMLYLAVAAPRVLPRVGGDSERDVQYTGERADELLTELHVTRKFSCLGQPVASVLARLGLPLGTLIKMRRRMPAEPADRVQLQETFRSESVCDTHRDGFSRAIGSEATAPRRRNVTPASGKPGYRKTLGGTSESTVDGSPVSTVASAAAAQERTCSPSVPRLTNTDRCRGYSEEIFLGVSTPEHRGPSAPRPFVIDHGLGHHVAEHVEHGDDSHHAGSYADIYPVAHSQSVLGGDVLVISCPRSTMVSFQGSILGEGVKGLSILNTNIANLAAQETSFFELVLSDLNHFVGRRPSGHENVSLSSRYGCRVVAVRHAAAAGAISAETDAGRPLRGAEGPPGSASVTQEEPVNNAAQKDALGVEVTRRPLAPGDVVLVVAEEDFAKKWKDSQSFDMVTRVGSVPQPVRRYDYLSLLVFCGMLGCVLFSGVVMVRAAFVAGGILIVGGWVDPKKAVGYVDWALLLLVGSALGLSKAISNSGLAGYAGNAIRESGMSASTSLYVLYGFTMICTELITNNAAAALAVPVALSISKELEVSYKPFVLTVMMAASSSFITPIGYQTNTMVWAPGGYKFSDFIKLGTPLSLIYLLVGSFLMPCLFPF